MSMLIGAGNALTNFGNQLGSAMIARKEQEDRDAQRQFQNMIAQSQLDLQTQEAAQRDANAKRDFVFKTISSLPQGAGHIDQAQGDAMLKDAPGLGMFFKPTEGTLPSRDMGMTQGGGIQPSESLTPGTSKGYDVTRPESDAYARAMVQAGTADKNRTARTDMGLRRIAQGKQVLAIRLQIAQMQDATKREFAQKALDSVMARHADSMALRGDANDLGWARADEDAANDFLRVMSNPLMMPPTGTKAPPPPSTKRHTGPATAPPVGTGDPVDDILAGMGLK